MAEIVAAARAHNELHDITGLLLFDGEHFVHTIEGEHAAVAALMARIWADRRHRDVKVVAFDRDVDRAFGGWPLADVLLGRDGQSVGDWLGHGADY